VECEIYGLTNEALAATPYATPFATPFVNHRLPIAPQRQTV
jgi:hypothetical protein